MDLFGPKNVEVVPAQPGDWALFEYEDRENEENRIKIVFLPIIGWRKEGAGFRLLTMNDQVFDQHWRGNERTQHVSQYIVRGGIVFDYEGQPLKTLSLYMKSLVGNLMCIQADCIPQEYRAEIEPIVFRSHELHEQRTDAKLANSPDSD